MAQGPTKQEKNFSDWKAPAVFKTSDFLGQVTTEELSVEGDDTQKSATDNSSPDKPTDDSTSHTTDR